MEKNIGWFDDRNNGPSVLTSVIAADTALINGISAESLAPAAEGICSLVAGICFGFYYCW